MAVMKMVALTMIGPQSEMEPVARQMVLTGGFQPLPLDMLINDRSLRSKLTTETENPYDILVTKISAIWKVAGRGRARPAARDHQEGFHALEGADARRADLEQAPDMGPAPQRACRRRRAAAGGEAFRRGAARHALRSDGPRGGNFCEGIFRMPHERQLPASPGKHGGVADSR